MLIIALLYFAVIGVSTQQCNFFTDTYNTCKENCTDSEFKDPLNKRCYTKMTECNGFIHLSRNLCLQQCPPNTTAGTDPTTKAKVCIDYDITLSKFPFCDLLIDERNVGCVSEVNCPTRTILQLKVCIFNSSCPSNFNESSHTLSTGETIKICQTKAYQGITANTCSFPNIIDYAYNTCLTSKDQCKAYYVESDNTCRVSCPSNLKADVDSANNRICIKCDYKDVKGNCYSNCPSYMKTDPIRYLCLDSSTPDCTSSQILDTVTPSCLDGPQNCKYYFVKATNTCQAQCPPYHKVVAESIAGTIVYKKCSPCRYQDPNGACVETCPSNTVADDTTGKCQVPLCRGVLDTVTFTCLDSPSKCTTGYYVPQTNTCQQGCPANMVVQSVVISGVTINSCVICNFKDLNQKCIDKCPAPSIPDSVKKVCVLPTCQPPQVKDITGTCLDNLDSCKGYYLRADNACLSQCPSNFTVLDVPYATFKICVPCNYKDSKGNCYEKCPSFLILDQKTNLCIEPPIIFTCTSSQVHDVANNICYDQIDQCKQFFLQEKMACLNQCPQLYKVRDSIFNNKVVKVCYPCFFQDQQGNCFEQCPSTMKVDTTRRLCVSDPALSCQKFYNKYTGECLDTCSFGYEPAQTSTLHRYCIPCTTSACFNPSSCTKKLSSNLKICSDICPFFEVPLPAKPGQSYSQCKRCPSDRHVVNEEGTSCQLECGATQVINPSTRSCIPDTQCQTYVVKDGLLNTCVNQCPKFQIPQNVVGKLYKLCVSCSTGEYIDPITQSCVPSCSLYDSNGITCLKNINDCSGFISSDQQSCSKQCNTNEYYVKNTKNNQCVAKCPSDTFIYDKICLKVCPKGFYADITSGSCISINLCKQYVTFDDKNCVTACPAGQYPQTTASGLKICKVCYYKLSSDGLTCSKSCPSTDIYDVDAKKCQSASNPNTCQNKIYSSDQKECSSRCPNGQLLFTNASGVKQCLKSIYDCPLYISSSFTECVKQCYGENEVAIQKGNNKICVKCRYGPNAEGNGCASYQSCNTLTQKFDLDLQQCVLNDSCAFKYTSVDGRKCSSQCVYPDVSRSSVSTTQCFSACDATETFVKDQGCVPQNVCTQYLSSDGKSCVDQCIFIQEAIDSSASNPKKCKKCLNTEIATVNINVTTQTQTITCDPISNDATKNSQTQADTLKSALQYNPKIEPEQKDQIKDKLTQVATSIETTISSTKQSLDLTEDQKKQQVKDLIQSIRDIANAFVKKLESKNSEIDNSLSLGQSQFQLVAEKKKEGFNFLSSFTLKDFFGANTPQLQTDPTTASASTLANTISSNIQTLSAMNAAQNPYCLNKEKCSSNGLFTVDYTLSTTGSRLLQQTGQQPTFQLTYNVDPSKINKSVCVSYDETTGNLQPAVSTTINKVANQVTCTFYTNSDLYYDSDCQYIDQSLCPSDTTTKPPQTFDDVEIVSGNTIFFSIISLFGLILSLF